MTIYGGISVIILGRRKVSQQTKLRVFRKNSKIWRLVTYNFKHRSISLPTPAPFLWCTAKTTKRVVPSSRQPWPVPIPIGPPWQPSSGRSCMETSAVLSLGSRMQVAAERAKSNPIRTCWLFPLGLPPTPWWAPSSVEDLNWLLPTSKIGHTDELKLAFNMLLMFVVADRQNKIKLKTPHHCAQLSQSK